MNYIIDFFESLKVEKSIDNIEFETTGEQIIVGSGLDCCYIFFGKNIFNTNLCKEIMFLNENQHDLKINNQSKIGLYLNKKIKQIPIDMKELRNIPVSNEDIIFLNNLEKKLLSFNQLHKIFLKFKIEENLPNKEIKEKKNKI